MKRWMHEARWVVVAVVAVVVGLHVAQAGARAQGHGQASGQSQTTVIRLKQSVSLAERARVGEEAGGGAVGEAGAARPVTLGDVAEIDGPQAEALRGAVVSEDARKLPVVSAGVGSVGLAAVRKVLDEARVNWGRTVLSGSVCEVRYEWTAVGTAGDRGDRGGKRDEPAVVDVGGEPTVRKFIARQLATNLGVRAEELRVLLRATDQAALDRPTGNWRVDVELGALATSARVPVRVFAYERDRLMLSVTVDAEVQVEKDVVVAARDLSKGESIEPGSVRVERRWMSPAQVDSALASLNEGVTPVAGTRIREGAVVMREMVQSPVAAKRGDVVWVHCLSGAIRIKAKARALETIRDGEVGAFKLEGSADTFKARMSGVGRAVMVVGDEIVEADTSRAAQQTAQMGAGR